MTAITTKFLGPTNSRGARIRAATTTTKNPATSAAESTTVAWDHALNATENHIAAMKALASKLNWTGEYVMGDNDTGYVFVRVLGHNSVSVGE